MLVKPRFKVMKNFIIFMFIVCLSVAFPNKAKAKSHYQIETYDNVQLVTKASDSFFGNTTVYYGLRVKGIEVCEAEYREIHYAAGLKLLLFSSKNGGYDELKVFSTETGKCLYYFTNVAQIFDIKEDAIQLKIKFGRSSQEGWFYEETFVRKDGNTQLVPKKRNPYVVKIPHE